MYEVADNDVVNIGARVGSCIPSQPYWMRTTGALQSTTERPLSEYYALTMLSVDIYNFVKKN